MKMTLEKELRPCDFVSYQGIIEEGLFHQWAESVEGGHKKIVAIIELKSGEIVRIEPHRIRFVDNKFREYGWEK